MPYCDIVFHKGKNKGQLCGDVSKVCRHQRMKCTTCGHIFGYKHNYTAHLKTCMGMGMDMDMDMAPAPISKLKPAVKVVKKSPIIIAKKPKNKEDDTTIIERLSRLEKENKLFEQQLQDQASRPQVNNYYKFVVVGDNFYDELINVMGKSDAVDFLANAAAKGKPLDVINKLYLEGRDPNKYPIACRHAKPVSNFRYLNNKHQIVDDKGGSSLGRAVSDKIQNAMLRATNELIKDGLDNKYDLTHLQRTLASMGNGLHLVNDLANVTENELHPFFKDDNVIFLDNE
jgi:hypothetical protein